MVQIWAYLGLSVLGAGIVRYLWRQALPILTARTKTTIDEHIAEATAVPVAVGVLIFGFWRTALIAKGHGYVNDFWLTWLLQGLAIATIYAVCA